MEEGFEVNLAEDYLGFAIFAQFKSDEFLEEE